MNTGHETNRLPTLAEAQGMTEELGRAIAAFGAREIQAGRFQSARDILEGLAVSNPYDPAPWTLLAQLERRRGESHAARFCAEVAFRLAPSDPQVRLARAELLVAMPADRERGRAELVELSRAEGTGEPVAVRAKALLVALGS
jgi:Flp pilus assembly protein TadD